MGSSLSTFTDFVNATGPTFITSAEDVINEAVKQSYILRRFLKGQDGAKVLQGGNKLKDQVIFDEQNTAEYYDPNSTFTWTNPQVLTEWEADWRFLVDHMSWTDQEVELQGASNYSRDARHQVYKRLKRSKEQRMWTSLINKMEDQLWRVPETADMEAATGKQPYSIPAMINHFTNGLFYSGATPTGKTAWTTKQGINPATETKWAPQLADYTSSAVSTGANNIIAAFDEMFYKVRFQAPPTKEQYFESTPLYSQFIICSRDGLNVYQRLMRDYQDTFVTTSRQDPAYIRPQYAGIDLEYATALDTALLYSDATATDPLVSETGATSPLADQTVNEGNGPRYYWENAMYDGPVFHTQRYMEKHPAMRHPNQPFTTIVPVDCWGNKVSRSLQRLGLIQPNGDIYSAGGVPV